MHAFFHVCMYVRMYVCVCCILSNQHRAEKLEFSQNSSPCLWHLWWITGHKPECVIFSFSQNKDNENEKGKKARAQRGPVLTHTKLVRAILVPTVPRETQNSRKPILEKPEPVCRDQHCCWIYGTLGTSICQVPHRQPWHWHRWRWIFIQSSEPSDSINPRGFDDEFLSFLFYLFSL